MADEGVSNDDVFAAINAVRADPTSILPALQTYLEAIDDNKILRLPGRRPVKTQEGRAAVEEAIAVVKATPRARRLAQSPGMGKACQDQLNTEADNFGHTGTDGSTPSERLNRYGKWNRGHGESLAFLHALNAAEDVIVNWCVDDGIPDRGHRLNLFRGCWQYGNVAVGPHPGPVSFKVVGLFASDYDGEGEPEPEEEKDFKSTVSVVSNDDLFDAINRFRANPQSFLPGLRERLANTTDGKVLHLPGVLPTLTHEGKPAIQEAIDAVEGAAAVPVVERVEALDNACSDHIEDCGPKGKLGHVGTDGRTPGDRANDYGKWHKCYGENLAYFCWKADDVILNWLIDDGVPARGHRVNLLREGWRYGGVGGGGHKNMDSMYVALFADVYAEDAGGEEDD